MSDIPVLPEVTQPLPYGISPKVSIVIPVYNGSNYLRCAIESALNQTYENIEIIVVNDGSNDNEATKNICLQFQGEITYLEQENTGVAGAINRAFDQVTGDLFCWLSHDDEFLPDKTLKQVSFLNSFSRKDLIAFSNYYLMDDTGEIWNESNLNIEALWEAPGLALLRGMVNGCSLMIPTNILRKHLPFDISLNFTQDYEMWDRLRKDAEFILMPETLIKYRIHATQDTDSTSQEFNKENDTLWIKMMEARSDLEKVILNGSRKKYYSELSKFLSTTSFKGAEEHAQQKSHINLDDVLVSIIIPFFNRAELTIRAIHSVLKQTHKNLQIIVINDGSTDDIDAVRRLVKAHSSTVEILDIPNGGPGHARNKGLEIARGEYIAFLDSDDVFLPNKIFYQLTEMMNAGAMFSHTSYHVTYPQGRQGLGLVDSGSVTGRVYPDIIKSCPIATPTVMVHNLAVKMGMKFPVDTDVMEDVTTWIWLAQKTHLLGISEPLSSVNWRDDSAALDLKKGIRGLNLLRKSMSKHPLHKLQIGALSGLDDMQQAMEEMYDFAISNTINGNTKNIVNLNSIRLAYNDFGPEKYKQPSGQQVLEVGHSKHTSAKEPYILKRRIS